MEDNSSLETLRTKSNEELMRLAQNDTKGAYDIICERLYGKFIFTANKILKNSHDAEDAVQKALFAGHIERNQFMFFFNVKFGKSAKVETWLTRILINKTKDIIKKNGGIRKPELGEDGEEPEGANTGEILDPHIDTKTDGTDPRVKKETRLLLISLEECIKKLPEEEKISIELREGYGIPYKEIVEILNERFNHSSLGNIKNKADSAKKKLKKCVESKMSSIKLFLKNKDGLTV